MFVRLSLLTMTSSYQMHEVLLFVCSKMADETVVSSKLPVADRTREVWGRKLCWWCLSFGLPLRTFLLSFANSVCFVFTSTPSYEASILCNLFLRLCWYIEVFKSGFEGVLVSLLLTTMGAFSDVVLHRGFSLANVYQAFWPVYHNCANFRRVCTPCSFQDFCVWKTVLPLDL